MRTIGAIVLVLCLPAGLRAADPEHLWSQSFQALPVGQAPAFFTVSFVTVDHLGRTTVAGAFAGATDFGGGPLQTDATGDAFVVSFDTLGVHRFSRAFAGQGFSVPSVRSVAVDGTGAVVLVGIPSDGIDFGGGLLSGNALFIAKFDADGVHSWSKGFPGGIAHGVAVDAADDIIVIGDLTNRIDFGGGLLQTQGANDVFLVKFDANGTHVWSRRFGAADNQLGRLIAVDASGSIRAAGTFRGRLDFGAGALTTVGEDAYVAAFDTEGNHVWSRKLGDESAQPLGALDVDADGNTLIVGNFSGWIDVGSGRWDSPPPDQDGFVASYTANGTHRWSLHVGGSLRQNVAGAAFDARGRAIVGGSFEGSLALGQAVLVSEGAADAFAARIDPTGAIGWIQRFGGPRGDAISNVATDPDGDMVFRGGNADPIDLGGGLVPGGGWFLASFGKRLPPPVLDITLFARGSAIEVRWGVSTEHGVESIAIERTRAPGSTPELVFSGPLGSGQGVYLDRDVVAGTSYRYELILTTTSGHEFRSSVVSASVPVFPNQLSQNAPNPFVQTSIAYSVSARADVVLVIYDVSGALVRRIDQGSREAGEYVVEWDGRDDAGNPVGSGVYFYRLDGVAGVSPRKMVLVR
ncbi:MAG TPA: FlgD immunoglobulin-like domain containing protein [Candidatus Krumholzibacteria bacterium]|nr:FlgD immunoglobulin-like domain containing protein [Candidatus Krumholzibacteria bacterium]